MRGTRASGEATLRWIRPDTPNYMPPGAMRDERRERGANTTAMIVIGLTLACTLLALFDLFQLASGL